MGIVTKLSHENRLYKNDPDYRTRISEGEKKCWEDPEYREKAIAGRRAAAENPQLSLKMRQSQKRYLEEHPMVKE